MTTSVERMWEVQRRLSFTQAIPIIGPLIFSPVKAFVSTAQIIASLASAIFLGIGFCLTNDFTILERLQEANLHIVLGGCSLAYAIINFSSYGLAGFLGEYIFAPSIKPIF